MENPTSIRRLLTRTSCIFLAALVVGYPLSIGPAYYVVKTHADDSKTNYELLFTYIYCPLLYIVGKVPVLESPLERYLNYWKERAVGDRR